MEICDNKSVGILVEDKRGRTLLIKRARFPSGYAPPAGHLDNHGSPTQAAIEEVREETGLRLTVANLTATSIQNRRVNNRCRRPKGDHHAWSVFVATSFSGTLSPSPSETEGAWWYTRDQLQSLVDRTRAHQAGRLSSAEWEADPGLESVWVAFLVELDYVS